MPFVQVYMEPRDDESKHRITREICDAMAECTNNSLAGTFVIFNEVPISGYGQGLVLGSRRPKSSAGPVRAEHVQITRLWINDIEAYIALRQDRINPALARQEGFVSTLLLQLDEKIQKEYLLLDKWLSKSHAEAWLESDVAKSLGKEASHFASDPTAGESGGATIVHQRFGRLGGAVLDGEHAVAAT